MSENNDLKKALHRAIAKAIKAAKPDRSSAIDSILFDIKDPNKIAQVDSQSIPVSKEAVLHKDTMGVKDLHDQKQAQAQAALGVSPLKEKGINKLKKFMEKISMKKAAKPL